MSPATRPAGGRRPSFLAALVSVTAVGAALLAGCGNPPAGLGDPTQAAATPTLNRQWSVGVPPLVTPWTDQVGPDNALPEYPRPQLARPTLAEPDWLNLNGVWEYEPWDGAGPIAFGAELAGTILVPYPEESALSGVQARSEYALYRRTVELPADYRAEGRHVRLNFGAVTYEATVYVNGQEVVRHTGGYDAFGADITAALVAGGPQEIVVAVHSPVDGANVPVGKQRLEPGGIFYTAASGIWQTVWLEPVGEASIASLVAVADVDQPSFAVTAAYDGDVTGAELSVTAFADGVEVASAGGLAGETLTLEIAEPRLWTPDDPFLYTLTATLTTPGGEDTVESYAGLREIAVEAVDGVRRITLNHDVTYLLGTLDQGYWPDGIYTAPTDEALKYDIQKTKDLGFNTIRKHVKVEPARWYYWCDVIGLMVWQDIPSLPDGRNEELSEADQENFKAEAGRIVDQFKNVTAIIGWVPFNEGWGQWAVEAADEVTEVIRARDPSRLVDARSGVNCCDLPVDSGGGDVVDWHEYQGPALPRPGTRRAAIDGEHGGLTLAVEGHAWPGSDLNPYGAVADAAELNAGYIANTEILREWAPKYGISGSIYTQITDVENEQNGLFTYDRQVEKVDEAAIRAINVATIEAGS